MSEPIPGQPDKAAPALAVTHAPHQSRQGNPISRFRLGFLTRVYSRDAGHRVLDETRDLFSAAEALGFDSGWVAQHHFGSENGRLPSPLVLLSAVAQRTRHIDIGTGVLALPLESALRLAEDAAVLDALSDGRLQLGVGTGFGGAVFNAFGRDVTQRHADTARVLQLLQRALAGEPLGIIDGNSVDHGIGQPGTPLTLQPATASLGRRLWQASGDVDAVAANGAHLIVAKGAASQADETARIARYRAQWPDAHPPRVALVRALVPLDDDNGAHAQLAGDLNRYVARMATERPLTDAAAPAWQDLATLSPALGVLHGQSGEIIAALREDTALPLATDLIVQVQTESTTFAQALKRLEAIATIIAPALGWQPATP